MIDSVTRRAEFDALRSRGQRVRSGALRMSYVSSPGAKVDASSVRSNHRVAFAISRKFGNAVERNRAKRRLKAAFAGLVAGKADSQPPTGLYLLIPSRRVLTLSNHDLIETLRRCFAQLGSTEQTTSR